MLFRSVSQSRYRFVCGLLTIKFKLAGDGQVDLGEVGADAFVVQSSMVKPIFEVFDVGFVLFERTEDFKTIVVDRAGGFDLTLGVLDHLVDLGDWDGSAGFKSTICLSYVESFLCNRFCSKLAFAFKVCFFTCFHLGRVG